ncbi:MAG: metal ABC transporter substrate-binding protein [Myxococcota bacterium]
MIQLLLLLVSVLSRDAYALDVVCTLPYLGSITEDLAPDAHVTVLARGNEDPHFLSPTPALMAKVQQADLYVENGMSLELWSAKLLDSAGNPKVRRGQAGNVIASTNVPRLEVPTEITRAKGDLHPEGNPHVWLDPLNAPIIADNIAAGLARVDPDHAADYEARADAFRAKVYEKTFGADLVGFMGGPLLDRLARAGNLQSFLEQKGLTGRLGGWLAAGADLRGKPVVWYHQNMSYFTSRFGLDVVGHIEDRPGIAPSAAHRAELANAMKAKGAKIIGVTTYYDDRLAQVLAEQTGARVVMIPGDVGGDAASTDWFAFVDDLVALLSK